MHINIMQAKPFIMDAINHDYLFDRTNSYIRFVAFHF